MHREACTKRGIEVRAEGCGKRGVRIPFAVGLCLALHKICFLKVAASGSFVRVVEDSTQSARKACPLQFAGGFPVFCMHGRHTPESAERDNIPIPRLLASFVLRHPGRIIRRYKRPQSSVSSGKEWRQRENRQIEVTSIIISRALDVSSTGRLSACSVTGAKGAEDFQFRGLFRESGLRVGNAVALALWCMRDSTVLIRPVSSMAPTSIHRLPQGCNASHASTKAGGVKRRAVVGRQSKTNDGTTNQVSKAATLKVEVKESTPTRKRKVQNEKVEALTKSEEPGKHVKKKRESRVGTTADKGSASTGKHTKREVASTAGKGDVLPDASDLFLAHRERALRTGKYLGAHISAAGGPQNAPVNCHIVGGQAFAFFLKNQRRWDSPPISKESAEGFKEKVGSLGLDGPQHILPHGSYLINLANPDSSKRETSYAAFLDDLSRCEQLGVHRYVFHPGSTVGACTKSEGLANIASCLNKALDATQQVTVLLENMAGQKNMLCSTFEDLRDIIGKVEKKDRIGVCLDTCHLFAAGFDIRTPEGFEKVMKSFDAIVGMKYLKGMHINDSKSGLSSGLDRHEHLGKGAIGIAAFKFIMQHPHWFKGMPLIIETPEEDNAVAVWRDEIKRLYEFADA